jgi:lipoprotein-releasing system permease protein
MNLILDIAWTHVRAHVRQTGFAVAGVATGVGFSIMMAALMVGSQDDFVQRMVDSLPHITVSDERRNPPTQPAAAMFDAAEFHGLTPEARRRGVKNPLALMAALEAWLPGAVAPSVKVQAIIRYANHDVAASVIGIEPRRESKVSELPKQMRGAGLNALYRATNAIVLGDRLAEKIGARIGANITLQTSEGAKINAQVVGLYHSGVRQIDETTAYTLTKTGQILARQTGMINELRVHLNNPLKSREIAARIESETGYKSVSWQEANEDLLSTFIIRNIIMYAVVGAILLVASFGTYNIISTITHEKARDIAIMKSLGLSEHTVRSIFVVEALIIGLVGALVGFVLGYLLSRGLGAVRITNPFIDSNHLPLAYDPLHYLLAGLVAMVSSVSAGYAPARKAAREHPVAIIRGAT